MKKIKSVIFDFGGVLIDWNPYYLLRKLMTNDTDIARFMQEINFKQWNYELDMGYPFDKGIADIAVKFPQYSDLIRVYDERWLETIGVTFNETIDLVRQVKDAGYRVFGLSNWSERKFSEVRPRYEFFNLFEDMVISGEVKLAKPDPRIYQVLLERNGLNANECLYIDDSEDNIRGGRQVGLNTIQYQSSPLLKEELQAYGIL
jgi:2-haloacid dehalogenase